MDFGRQYMVGQSKRLLRTLATVTVVMVLGCLP